jgi:serine/threonine protein phosphatase PrpC
MSLFESIKYNTFYSKGQKDQDTHHIIDTNDFKIFIVLDGHGVYGTEYVNSVKSLLAEKLVTIDYNTDTNTKIRQVFKDVNTQLNISKFIGTGCTASIVFILKDKMIVANVGDSDVYMFDDDHNLTLLSGTHSGTNKDEMERLKEFPHTKIVYATTKGTFDSLVWSNDKMNQFDGAKFHYCKNRMEEPATYICCNTISNKLAMTRSLGDYALKSYGITWEPEIREYPLPTLKSQILIGSDGFWDSWTEKELIKELGDVEKRKNVHKTSIDLSTFYFGKGTADDNTLIHITF